MVKKQAVRRNIRNIDTFCDMRKGTFVSAEALVKAPAETRPRGKAVQTAPRQPLYPAGP